MNPTSVRERILREHQEMRRLLDRLEAVARTLARGDRTRLEQAQALREGVSERLSDKIDLEGAILAPVLREVDSWGDMRVEKLHEYQREQRASLDGLDRDAPDQATLAERWQRCVVHLREELRDEEADLLSTDLLRDDVIGIGVEGG